MTSKFVSDHHSNNKQITGKLLTTLKNVDTLSQKTGELCMYYLTGRVYVCRIMSWQHFCHRDRGMSRSLLHFLLILLIKLMFMSKMMLTAHECFDSELKLDTLSLHIIDNYCFV